MKPAPPRDQLVAGPEIEVVGIAQKDGDPAMVEVVRTQGLDARLGPHGHEDGGRESPVGRDDFTQARAA